jgi:hypothetical protein
LIRSYFWPDIDIRMHSGRGLDLFYFPLRVKIQPGFGYPLHLAVKKWLGFIAAVLVPAAAGNQFMVAVGG